MSPPIVGVPFLEKCVAGPSSRWWPLPCLTRNKSMMAGPSRNTKQQRRHDGAAGAEGDVAKNVQLPHLAAFTIEHSPILPPAPVRSAPPWPSTSGGHLVPLSEPLIITTSPARTTPSKAGVSSIEDGAQRPRRAAQAHRSRAASSAHRQEPDRRWPRQPLPSARDAAPATPLRAPACPPERRRDAQGLARGDRHRRERRLHRDRIGVVALVDQQHLAIGRISPCARPADGRGDARQSRQAAHGVGTGGPAACQHGQRVLDT